VSGEAADGRRATLVAMTIASGITSLPTAAIVLAIPVIHRELQASIGELQWTVTAFLLAYSALLIAAGRLGDIFGRRLMFVAGSALYAAGSVVAALANDATILIVGIAFIGGGAAVLLPASLSLITESFPPERRGAAIGLWGAASALVQGLGPAIGGLLTDQLSWRWIFWLNLVAAAVMIVLVVLRTRESRDESAVRHVDVLGLVLSAAGLVALTLALNEGSVWRWGSEKTIVVFAAAGLLLAAFGLLEPRIRSPLVDFAFFRIRNFTGANLVVFVLNFILGAMLFFLPLYFQELLGYSPLKAGMLLLPLSATLVVGMPLGGPIAERVGPRIPIVAGLALMAVGMFLISDVTLATQFSDVWPPMALIGFGAGLAITPMNLAAMNSVEQRRAGAASGILITISGLGGAFGVAVSGALFQELQTSRTAELATSKGIKLTQAGAQQLDGLLAGSPAAQQAAHRLGQGRDAEVTHAVREAFVSALGSTMKLSAAIGVAGLVLTIAIMRGRGRSAPAVATEPAA
jgi:EmrB/QacA subfamily drug resistance transporter